MCGVDCGVRVCGGGMRGVCRVWSVRVCRGCEVWSEGCV